MKKLFTSLAAMIIVAIAIIMFLGCDNTKDQSSMDQMSTTTTISSTTDVTTETSVTTSTIKYSTTTTDTTSSTYTTATSATTTATMVVATTEYTEEEIVLAKEEFVEVKEKSVKEEYIPMTEEYQQTTTHTETVTIPVTEVEETYYEETTTQSNMTINYSINQLTYYSGPSGCKGRWDRTLLNNYSIASNLLPDGAIVHIESNDGSINGDYRVDDTGGMGNNVIDIFYTSYSNVPYPFSRDGRISCTVWVYE